jgi:hypothetical protein
MHFGKLYTTVLLALTAVVAISLAPRLQPVSSHVESVANADVCVSLGRFECCVKDEEPDRRR